MTEKMISWEQFESEYKPQQNHITKREEFNGWLFETYGDDLEYIKTVAKESPERVWTIVGPDVLSVINGFHYVNRFGYIITELPADLMDVVCVIDEEDQEELVDG